MNAPLGTAVTGSVGELIVLRRKSDGSAVAAFTTVEAMRRWLAPRGWAAGSCYMRSTVAVDPAPWDDAR